jgi:hypothetical protein
LIPFKDLDRLILRGPADRPGTQESPAMAMIHQTEDAEVPFVPPIDAAELTRRNRAAAALLDSWEAEGDEDEQRETFVVLRRALGERRVMSSRAALP